MQPLLVFPTDTGIDIVFRKKPTSERGSTDGGLIIKVEEKSVLWDPHRVPGATRARGLEGARPSADTAAADAVKMPRGRKGGEDLYDVPRATVAVSLHTQSGSNTCMHACMHAYMHTCIHTHTHTHTHTPI